MTKGNHLQPSCRIQFISNVINYDTDLFLGAKVVTNRPPTQRYSGFPWDERKCHYAVYVYAKGNRNGRGREKGREKKYEGEGEGERETTKKSISLIEWNSLREIYGNEGNFRNPEYQQTTDDFEASSHPYSASTTFFSSYIVVLITALLLRHFQNERGDVNIRKERKTSTIAKALRYFAGRNMNTLSDLNQMCGAHRRMSKWCHCGCDDVA